MMGTPKPLVTVLAVVLALVSSPSVDDLTMKCVAYLNLATVLADW